jgi:hypothetical protein
MNDRNILTSLSLTIFVFLILSGMSFAASERGKGLSKDDLPVELKGLTVADHFIDSREKTVASIVALEGNVVVERPKAKQAYFAAVGDSLFESDVIYTLQKSRCKFKLVTEDKVTVGPQSKLGIKEVIDDRSKKSKASFFSMDRGMAIFHIVRVPRYSKQSMEAETPTAVSGIRGSKFGVEIKRSGGKAISAQPVLLADASDQGFTYLAQAPKDDTVTVVHDLEGNVEVKSKKDNTIQFLKPGQSVEATLAGLGKIFKTPAKMLQQFMGTVEVGIEKYGKKAEKAVENKMEKPIGAMDKLGRDLDKRFGK